MAVAVRILCLYSALRIKPVLQSHYVIGLLVIQHFAFVKIVIRCNDIHFGEYMCRCRYVVAVAFHVSIFSGQVFCAYINRFGLNHCTCRPTVTRIVFTYLYIRIKSGSGYCASLSFNKRTTYG